MRCRFELEFSLVLEAEPPPGISEQQLRELAAHVLETNGATGGWEITVALVDDARLQALHRDFMGIDSPTDIMTFPASEPAGPASGGGELAISVDHARSQAAAWGHTPAEEVRFLLVHGLLHLLGWTDDNDERARPDAASDSRSSIAGWQVAPGLSVSPSPA